MYRQAERVGPCGALVLCDPRRAAAARVLSIMVVVVVEVVEEVVCAMCECVLWWRLFLFPTRRRFWLWCRFWGLPVVGKQLHLAMAHFLPLDLTGSGAKLCRDL